MKITITVPETVQDQIIDHITFNLVAKEAVCHLEKVGDSDGSRGIVIDVTPALNNATATQLTTIKTFFKWIMSQAYGVLESEIPDTVFDPNA